MQLLVSVVDSTEAEAAVQGGADIIDAKDPASGPLAPVSPDTLAGISAVVASRRRVSAALGDASVEAEIERLASAFADAGASFVKVGFAGIASPARVLSLARATIRGASMGSGPTGVVAVAYADSEYAESLVPETIAEIATAAGMNGLLIDTANKDGPGLCRLVETPRLTSWVSAAHSAGLFMALAGRLTLEDLPRLRETGTDIAGVRGAACKGGRTGPIDAERVRLLRSRTTAPVTLSAG